MRVFLSPYEFSTLWTIDAIRLSYYILVETVCLFSAWLFVPEMKTEVFGLAHFRILIVKCEVGEVLHSVIEEKETLLIVEKVSHSFLTHVFLSRI